MSNTTNYVEQTGTSNPFDGISVGASSLANVSTPVLVDLDGDGDLDLAIGKYTQNPQAVLNSPNVRALTAPTTNSIHRSISYYENNGTSTSPNYVEQTGSDNPFNNIQANTGIFLTPSFGDVDADGDLDLIIEDGSGYINYYQNDGSAASPNYVQKTGSNNPFDNMWIGYDGQAPALVDLDDDGDADLVVGDGYIQYFENDRNSTGPNYVEKTGADNPFAGLYVGNGYGAPTFADYDKDGDLDAWVGLRSDPDNNQNNAPLLYLERTGDTFSITESNNAPFDNVRAGTQSFNAPTVGDVDGDGDLDILVGDSDGGLTFYTDARTEAMLTPYENKTAFEVTSLGSGNTLVVETESVAQFSEIVIFSVDDADGSNPEQVASFSVLESGKLGGDFAPEMSLNSSLVESGQFFQVQLIENGVARMATLTSLSDGQLALDFGGGTVLMIQPGTESAENLLIGDADGIDLGDSGNPMEIEFNVYREADYNNTVGLYTTDTADGGILIDSEPTDLVTDRTPNERVAERALDVVDGLVADELTGTMLMPGDEGYKEAAMARRLDVTLTGENGNVQSFSAALSGEDQFLASFLIADGSDFNSDEVYFSHMGANSNGNDHAKYLGNNTFGFEDMAGLGDRDYNDIVVSFTATEMINPDLAF